MCECCCGNKKAISASSLRGGVSKSCGCMSKTIQNKERIEALIGSKYGKWTIIKPTDNRDSCGAIKYLVECECGNKKEVILNVLKSGKSQSCGCSSSSKGEQLIVDYLERNKISYVREFSFVDFSYKGGGRPRFDFCVLNKDGDIKALIEYDGKQHFESSSWGGDNALKERVEKDKEKDKYCLINSIKLIRIKYTDINNIEFILKGENLNE